MFKNSYLIIFLFLTLFGINMSGQHEYEKYGCKYIKSKIKLRGFTEAELKYAEDLEFRSDTFDIVNYRIKVDVTDFSSKKILGQCDIDFTPKMTDLNYILFDLLEMTVDSVVFNNSKIDYNYTSPSLRIDFDTLLSVDDTLKVSVFYHGISKIDPSGFGGFYFEKSYAFNLGIGLSSIPHNYGRSWFPCFDNFVERSSYDFDIITRADHFAYCVGNYLGVDTLNNGKKIFHFRMDQQIPTYQAGVAVADYREINWNFEGVERNIPIQLVGKPQDTSKMKTSFAYLPFAIEAFEKWYGPYQWNRVGYVLTSNGAMEHPTNIAFPDFLGNNGDPEITMDIMAHELAHHWWGDHTTLTTAYDMWIKEGTSEYGSHQFFEYFFGEDRFREVMKENNYEVITSAHVKDKEYRALSGMPMEFTYGPTTYNKGAMVIHNLRTYMGDSLFMIGMRSILKTYAFSHLDAAQFKNELESSTGLDMTCFFDDWIYSPGFNAFEIDSIKFILSENEYKAKLFIEQKLHHAPHYHCSVPLEITFYDDNFDKLDFTVMASGKFSEAEITIPFYPTFWTINENQRLNNSQLGGNYFFYKDKSYSLKREKITIKTPDLVPDSVFMRVEHTWGQPDPVMDIKPEEYLRVSNSHYWTISGKLPADNTMTASFFYNGSNASELDFDLANTSEDSIFIAYRPDAGHEWKLHPNMQKQKLVPKDGRGNVIVTGLFPGQYAFANFASTTSIISESENNILVYPMPASSKLYLSIEESVGKQLKEICIYSINGEKISVPSIADKNTISIDVSGITTGIYIIQLIGEHQKVIKSQKIIIDQD